MVARDFGGKPVREQNLSEWRKHGYKEWRQRHEALDMTRQLLGDIGRLQPPGAPPLADQMAVCLIARLLVAVQKQAEKSGDGELDSKTLRELVHDVVAVRRGDHSGARLKMERERLEREREKTEEELVAQFERRAENQRVRDWICQAWVNPEERKRRVREILGLPPEPPETAATDGPEDPAKEDADVEIADTAGGPVNGHESGSTKPN